MATVLLLPLVALFSLVLPTYCRTLSPDNEERTLAPTGSPLFGRESTRRMGRFGAPVDPFMDTAMAAAEAVELDRLDDATLAELIQVEDDILVEEISQHMAKKQSPQTEGSSPAGRAFLDGFVQTDVTRNGSLVTSNYARDGDYTTALRNFRELHPDNVKPVKVGQIGSYMGTVGKHFVTVRYGSKGDSRPTLEISSEDGNVVRIFRYYKAIPQ